MRLAGVFIRISYNQPGPVWQFAKRKSQRKLILGFAKNCSLPIREDIIRIQQAMNLISYVELAGLRLQQFLGDAVKLQFEESGMQVVVGLGGYERFGETYFEWKQGELYRTAAITLDLGKESILPDGAARRIIEKLRLPVRKAMAASELIERFGTPVIDTEGAPGSKRRCMRFVCGEKDHYYLGCVAHDQDGLIHLFLARKDYVDEDEAI